ncbi:hypothetical protein, partial [Salmonella sp. SAL04277]
LINTSLHRKSTSFVKLNCLKWSVALKEAQHFVVVQNNHIAGTGFIPVNDRIHPEKMVFWFEK